MEEQGYMSKWKNTVAQNVHEWKKEEASRQPDEYRWVLFAVECELSNKLFKAPIVYEEREYYQELDRTDFYEAERNLVDSFELWARRSDDNELAELLYLNPKTKRWLKRHCKNWGEYERRAQNAYSTENGQPVHAMLATQYTACWPPSTRDVGQ